MKEQGRKYFKEDIRRTFLIYALIPISMITLITYCSAFFIWNRMIISQTRDKNRRMQQKLEQVVTSFMKKTVEFAEDADFYEKLQQPRQKSAIYQKLYTFSNSIEEQVDFYIFDEKLEMLAGSTKEIPNFIPKDSHISWGITKRMKDNPTDIILECNKTYKDNLQRTKLLIGHTILQDNQIKGYILFILYGDEFIKTSGSPTTQILVTDQYDNLFLATTPGFSNTLDKIKGEFKEEDNYVTIDGDKYYKEKSSIVEGKLRIYTFTSVGRLMKVFIWAGLFFILVILTLSIAMLVIAEKIAKEKTHIIDRMVDAFKEVQEGNLDVTLDIKSYDEFEIIGESYNLMLASIKNLLLINEERVRQTILSEIKQLESQFNPHFLFNTLEHIRYMAKLDPHAASKMIVSLSTLLRYSINNNLSDVTIAEDLEYTKSYLHIQQYRFSERFHYTTYMERGTEECIVPKLILQPIIENAIKYGFGDKEDLTVRIKVSFLADDLVIVIYDDGVGMQQEILEELQHLLKQGNNTSNHIGLYNVHRRIQLMYGEAYGVELKSEIGEGTVVKIILPINKRGK
ncbi:histidine kinase [Sporanaerobium hydrogeniformans]|uniref:Histidine kinase n=1 Tax=Sporanaerobium hydrogeniformans TaxID=3072179 RepID=A0AC61DB37_9FIRM|nr:sensor histidine kinase [Sporanaerobium hydrogeniformans]PHV69968.1 histidine kinase [Sporanaerobium hydrogeniformans]